MNKSFHTKLAYPDPFVPSEIEFELPEDAIVTIKIFHSSGKEIKTLIQDTHYPAGNHKICIKDDDCTGKNYIYRIIAIGEVQEYSETRMLD